MTRPQAIQLRRIERDRNAIIRQAGLAVLRQYAAWRSDILSLWRNEGYFDPTYQADELLVNVQTIHREGAAVALLRGYRRVALGTGKRELVKPIDERPEYAAAIRAWSDLVTVSSVIQMRLPGPTAFQGAMAVLRGLVGLTTGQAAILAERFDGLALQSSARLLGHANKIIDRAYTEVVARGLSIEKGTKLVDRAIRRAGLSPKAPWAVEREIRDTSNLAYSAGRETGRRDPVIAELIHSLTYVTTSGDRTRPSHAALEGITRPLGDPFWDVNTPPNGYNCQCQQLENFEPVRITDTPPRQMALSSELDDYGRPKVVSLDNAKAVSTFEVGADPGWRFNPGDVFGGLVAA